MHRRPLGSGAAKSAAHRIKKWRSPRANRGTGPGKRVPISLELYGAVDVARVERMSALRDDFHLTSFSRPVFTS